MGHDEKLAELKKRRESALAMGPEKRHAARTAGGVLSARARADYILDEGSFHEVGLLAVSEHPADRERSAADGYVCGFGKIDGREVALSAADFTTLGASSAIIAGKKLRYLSEVARVNGLPQVLLSECAGGRMPDIMGARGMGRVAEGLRYARRRETPWACAVLGQAYGNGTWQAMYSDFVVMRKGAVMAVSSPRVTSVALGEDMDPQELGGWEVHAKKTGLIDAVAESDEQALDLIRGFLSYLPSHAGEAPPRAEVPAGAGEAGAGVGDLVPTERTRGYDIRKVIRALVDKDSYFPLKEDFGRVAVTALARLDGRSVGIIATNPMFKGGALDVEACEKIISFIVLCDSFNVPLILLADTPGFLVGSKAEHERVGAKIINFLQALDLATVPKFSVILRKSYGQAYINMGGGRSDEMAAWPGAEIGFMEPGTGVNVVFGVRKEDDP
ncbi:MAG: methylmalonyl-CoA carboxyltransferase, partial [Chrysiogenetes bacterium]|nr:methylmalonyl-CoA carboxyltransferase [Chrysiogenetes bacterium]